ncbi:hypothetical protein FVO59_03580 [Microbacterium esteraromaticum]|uniref:DUF2178 domain-containing protein n=1 Tax=Microbacterium esteraromaticum TaxID=57043 RepID=A0A7D7WE70_9MICO|nr:hypothetical protein [Microbacterium esteraromaticum]QMU96391.1 hypothetical protein FVO59_03580 [Microbacterium esteraromaticum]
MVYQERVAWAGLIGTVVSVSLYLFLLWGFRATPVEQTDWLWPMLWAIGVGIGLSIVISIVWGIIAGRKDLAAATATDIRDRDITRMGGRVEHSFLVIAGVAVISLCAFRSDPFWIAQTMYAGFAVSAFIGGIARVIAYRRGLV